MKKIITSIWALTLSFNASAAQQLVKEPELFLLNRTGEMLELPKQSQLVLYYKNRIESYAIKETKQLGENYATFLEKKSKNKQPLTYDSQAMPFKYSISIPCNNVKTCQNIKNFDKPLYLLSNVRYVFMVENKKENVDFNLPLAEINLKNSTLRDNNLHLLEKENTVNIISYTQLFNYMMNSLKEKTDKK